MNEVSQVTEGNWPAFRKQWSAASLVMSYPATFMALFSSNVLGVSVVITWARISTAWPCRLCRRTKSSLARIQAAAPSEVGLRWSIDTCSSIDNTEKKKHCLILWWNSCVVFIFSKIYIFLNMKITIVIYLFQEYCSQRAIKWHVYPYLFLFYFSFLFFFIYYLFMTKLRNSTKGQCMQRKDSNATVDRMSDACISINLFTPYREQPENTGLENYMLIFE